MCVLRGHLPAAYRLRRVPTGGLCGIAAGHDVYGRVVCDLRMSSDGEISSCGLSRGRGGSAYVRHVVWLVVADAGEGRLPAELPLLVDRGLRLARVDFAPARRQPSGLRVVVALVLSVAGSLAVDVLLVAL